MEFKKHIKAAEAILELAIRMETLLPPRTTSEILELLKYGEWGLALEQLLGELYEYEVTPSPEDKLRLIQLGLFFQIPKDLLSFWPDPPPNRDDHGGNADPPRLLGGELEPLTYTVGFLHTPLEQVLHALPRYRRGWFNRRIRTISTGDLRDMLLTLEQPNFSGEPSLLVTATAAPGWTALFDNTAAGVGVVPVAADLARRLRVRGYAVRSIPPWSYHHRKQGSRHFFALGPETPSGIIRRVETIECPVSSWTFDYHGEPQPFEDTSRYDHPHQDERFTNDMLRAYAEAVGLDPWREDFYHPPGHIIPS
ncbi:MafI family immunity protein [Buchananella hordeovulneris]|uniref:MafI family immunity protein n=1 Tax=Buchananella hordeovulneris TaxID=52770 RepID=UPI000F5D94CE|nr:MafI family immunity protein [Buchananella hordeovulneris]MDO5080201.1 MafI family immunity protein [Buchananella hordeovulneris]RRD43866.1 MafI family immunity protein [Buchananella hordeovulneris]RRD52207.1 MafI family immunity protein [Buchananella hordeovulneris]